MLPFNPALNNAVFGQGQKDKDLIFNCTFTPGVIPRDSVTGTPMSTVIPGTRHEVAGGKLYTYGVNEPAIHPEFGLRGVGVVTNLIETSNPVSSSNGWSNFQDRIVTESTTADDPAGGTTACSYIAASAGARLERSVTVGAGEHIVNLSVWLKGTGTCSLRVSEDGGSYTVYGQKVITLTDEWQRYDCTATKEASDSKTTILIRPIYDITGTVEVWGAQLTESKYPLPYVPTNGSVASTVSEAGGTDVGNFWNFTDIPAVKTALESEGEMRIKWVPMYPQGTGEANKSLVSCSGSHINVLYAKDDNNGIQSYDGTKGCLKELSFQPADIIDVRLIWGFHSTQGQSFQVIVNSVGSTIVAFDGSFSPAIQLNLFQINKELNYIKSIKFYSKPRSWV
jgi:hypothetical protein